jgi:hypothetical protein
VDEDVCVSGYPSIEYHPDAVALAICGRYRSYGNLPIWGCVQSARFRREFGRTASS